MPARRTALSLYPELLKLNSTGSSSDDYRGVIDDLTIQNKRLRKRLRRYERIHDAQPQDDKLFEVRVHGLSGKKKRELEELLRGFAQSLGKEAADEPQDDRGASRTVSAVTKPTTSLASTRLADSGYGSMTTPNLNSNTTSATPALPSPSRGAHASAAPTRDRNIRSYLLDLPSSLLVKPPTGLSARDKKKLIARRLEQLFQGRGALPDSNQQHVQQQQLSHLASKNEAAAYGTAPEGSREARIMLSTLGDASPDKADDSARPDSGVLADKQAPKDVSSENSPFDAQRPTRPLDLDPSRAQVASDNMEYIRHLGFDVPLSGTQDSAPADGEGWIYLNLLINMAQLHTINVTPDFVKSAIRDFSNELELSVDGRKVRWRAHPNLARDLSNSTILDGSASQSSSADLDPQPSQKRKRSLTDDASAPTETITSGANKLPPDNRKATGLVYAPLFHRHDDSEDEDASMVEDESSQSSPELAEAAALPKALRGPKPRSTGEGPIIFYNNPYFCTDLSGDNGLADLVHISLERQQPVTSVPVGTTSHHGRSNGSHSSRGTTHRYFADGSEVPAEGQRDSFDGEVPLLEFDFQNRTPKRVAFADEADNLEFESSGLGGVVPADHLTIAVVKEQRPHVSHRRVSSMRPPLTRLDAVLHRVSPGSPPTDRIVSARTTFLPPSALPEPSMAFDSSDLSDDEDSAEDSDPDTRDSARNASRPLVMSVGPISSKRLSSSPDSGSLGAASAVSSIEAESGSQTGVVDFLDTARRTNPEAVRAMEREYDAEMAERLAEEIPAGSSAATAGGGSHNPSPLGALETLQPTNARRGSKEESSDRSSNSGGDRSISS